MSDLIPTHRLTHSKFGLTKFCSHWCSKDGPRWPEDSAGRGAHVGSAFHICADSWVNKLCIPPKQLMEAGGYTGSIARDAEALYAIAKPWMETHVPSGARSEVGLAFDPQTGTGREIAMAAPRDYSQALPREVPGTADLFWIVEASFVSINGDLVDIGSCGSCYGTGIEQSSDTGEDCCPECQGDGTIRHRIVYLYDWETGRSYYKGAAHDNDQIAIGALIVSDIYGADCAVVGVIHVSTDKGVEVREHLITKFELDALRQSFRERGRAQVEPQPAKPGWWCHGKWCPCRYTCSVSGKDAQAADEAGAAIENASSESPDGAMTLAYESKISFLIDSDEKWREVRQAEKRARSFLDEVKKCLDSYAKSVGGVETGEGKIYGPHKSSRDNLSEAKALQSLSGIVTDEELDLIAPRKISKTSITNGLPKERAEELLKKLREDGALVKKPSVRWEER